MKVKILFFYCIFLIACTTSAFSWTLDQVVSGVDGQTVGAGASVEGSVNLESLGYTMIILVCQCTSEVDVNAVSICVRTSVDGGTTISEDYLIYRGGLAPSLIYKIYHYPYIKVIVANATEESGANDDTVVYCRYAVY